MGQMHAGQGVAALLFNDRALVKARCSAFSVMIAVTFSHVTSYRLRSGF